MASGFEASDDECEVQLFQPPASHMIGGPRGRSGFVAFGFLLLEVSDDDPRICLTTTGSFGGLTGRQLARVAKFTAKNIQLNRMPPPNFQARQFIPTSHSDNYSIN